MAPPAGKAQVTAPAETSEGTLAPEEPNGQDPGVAGLPSLQVVVRPPSPESQTDLARLDRKGLTDLYYATHRSLGKYKREVSSLQDFLARKNKQYITLQQSQSSYKTRMDTFKNKFSDKEAELKRVNIELKKIKDDNLDKGLDIKRKAKAFNDEQAELKKLQTATLAEKAREIQNWRQMYATRNARVQQLTQQQSSLKEDLKQANNFLEVADRCNRHKDHEMALLKEDLASKQSELEKLRSSFDEAQDLVKAMDSTAKEQDIELKKLDIALMEQKIRLEAEKHSKKSQSNIQEAAAKQKIKDDAQARRRKKAADEKVAAKKKQDQIDAERLAEHGANAWRDALNVTGGKVIMGRETGTLGQVAKLAEAQDPQSQSMAVCVNELKKVRSFGIVEIRWC